MKFLSMLTETRFQYPSGTTLYFFGFSIFTAGALLVLEAVWLGWEKSSIKRLTVRPSRSAQMDLALCTMYALNITPILAVVLSFGLGFIAPLWIRKIFGFSLLGGIENPWLSAFAYAALYDFLFYWKHRFSHQFRWWWQVHELHHSATELNLITANRLHPADEAVTRIFTCLPLALAGAPPETYLAIRALHFAQTLLIHSDLPWTWGVIGKYVLVPPAAHRIHHSDLLAHRDKNFGNLTPLWDHLFGTWHSFELGEPIVLTDRVSFHARPWYADIWSSYVRALEGLAAAVGVVRRAKSAAEAKPPANTPGGRS